jgi:hypothetical protein
LGLSIVAGSLIVGINREHLFVPLAMKRQDDIKSLEVRSKLLHKTLGSKIYPLLVPKEPQAGSFAREAEGSALKRQQGMEWGNVLDEYFTAAKQLDDLQHEMKTVFSVHIPVPRKVYEGGFSAFSIPHVLSTMVPKEDVGLVVIASNSGKYGTPQDQKHLERKLVEEHNDRMERVLEHFAVQVEGWRSSSKAAKLVENEKMREVAVQARKRKREEKERAQ